MLFGAGLVAVMLSRSSGGSRAPSQEMEKEDLEQKRATLYRLLADLNASRDTLPEAHFLAERRRLELEAARILQQQVTDAPTHDEGGAPDASEQPLPTSAPALDPATIQRAAYRRGAATAVGVIGLFVILGALLARFSSERVEGGSLTGNTTMVGAPEGGGGGQPMAAPTAHSHHHAYGGISLVVSMSSRGVRRTACGKL